MESNLFGDFTSDGVTLSTFVTDFSGSFSWLSREEEVTGFSVTLVTLSLVTLVTLLFSKSDGLTGCEGFLLFISREYIELEIKGEFFYFVPNIRH